LEHIKIHVHIHSSVLGAFTKLQRVSISFIMLCHVCPSTWSNSTPTVQIFMKFGI